MRILLSAYACEPNIGSEPGVGWNWAIELQRQSEFVVVLTRTNNKPKIEAFFDANPNVPKPEFVYYDLPAPILRLKRMGLIPLQLYYLLWQIFCVGTARKAAGDFDLNLVWHLTFGIIRLPSFLWRLKKPFVLGPLGGGETAPYPMRADYRLFGQFMDHLRDGLNWLSTYDPSMHATFNAADLILVRTPESARLVPGHCSDKVKIFHEVGITEVAPSLVPRAPAGRILYAGGFYYWKGVTIAIRAFAEFIRLGGNGRFTLIGKGPEKIRAHELAKELGIDHLLDWISWVDQRELFRIYADHDLFLFPSLHDSGGTVVVEAMSRGLPVMCLDLGGPGQIVTPNCGVIQPTARRTAREAAREIGVALKGLLDDPTRLRRLSEGALSRAQEFQWSVLAAKALKEIDRASAHQAKASKTLLNA